MATARAEYGNTISEDNKAFLLACLKKIILIRSVEQASLDLSVATPPKIAGSIHLCAGQEAVPVGAVAGLQPQDQIVATYRGHGWAMVAGLSLTEVLGEICHRSVGINGGRGGSAYMMAPWTRFIGENSIVGAGVPIACGVAQANRAAKNEQVVIVSVGEGAFNQGSTHEGLCFAAAQSLPVLVMCENNGWSELTASAEIFKIARVAERAAGYGIPGFTIDGTDPLAVRDTVAEAAQRARRGEGATVIECRVPRLWGHYNRDIEHYRPKEDRAAAQQRDPIALLAKKLVEAGVLSGAELEALWGEARQEIEKVLTAVWAAPPADTSTAGDHVWGVAPPAAIAETGRDTEIRETSYIQAVRDALALELETRGEVLVYGEDVGQAGGIFGGSRGLQRLYGAQRVFDTPIAESAILGSAVGAALMGMKPIVEIMWADFMLVALDQLINQAANVRYITGGRAHVPMVVRMQQGATAGSCAQHSQSLEALLAHIPGLKVALPATPQDAYDLLRTAVADPDPCIVIEARGLYQTQGRVNTSGPVQATGRADLKRTGSDAVIVTWGTMVRTSLEAAELAGKEGIHAGVLDLRWLAPLDEEALRDAVLRAQGRVVVAHEANVTGGFGAEIVARLHEMLGAELTLRIKRVGAPNIRMPAAPNLSQQLLPNAERIAAAVRSVASC